MSTARQACTLVRLVRLKTQQASGSLSLTVIGRRCPPTSFSSLGFAAFRKGSLADGCLPTAVDAVASFEWPVMYSQMLLARFVGLLGHESIGKALVVTPK